MVSPLVISRTFLRFSKNLDYIRRCATQNSNFAKSSFGKVMEIWISALFNSLLIEEVIFRKGISDINLKLDPIIEDNITVDNSFFIHNLKEGMGIKSQGKGQDDEQGVAIPYTLAMLCCPFFLVFLKGIFNSSEVFDKIAEQDIYKNISRTESLVQLQDSNEKDPYRLFLENVMKTTYELQIIATRKINKGRLKIIL